MKKEPNEQEYKTWYFTFMMRQKYKDNWVEVKVPVSVPKEESYSHARHAMVKKYGTEWAFQYYEDDFTPEYFPGGCLEVLMVEIGQVEAKQGDI